MKEPCFALRRDQSCKALDLESKCPGSHKCPFYKPKWLVNKRKKAVFKRLESLPEYVQLEIAIKYYDGKMPWRGDSM